HVHPGVPREVPGKAAAEVGAHPLQGHPKGRQRQQADETAAAPHLRPQPGEHAMEETEIAGEQAGEEDSQRNHDVAVGLQRRNDPVEPRHPRREAVQPPQPAGLGPGEHRGQRRQGAPRRDGQRFVAEAEAPQDAAGDGEEDPHHPGPLLPASPPPAGRRGSGLSRTKQRQSSSSPLSPGRWGRGWERGGWGSEGRPEGAPGSMHPHSVTQVSYLNSFCTFTATFWASAREVKGPMRTLYMVWPATSTGERKAFWPPPVSFLRMRSACARSWEEKTWMTTAPLGTAGSISDGLRGRAGVFSATAAGAAAPLRPLPLRSGVGTGVGTGGAGDGTGAALTGDGSGAGRSGRGTGGGVCEG